MLFTRQERFQREGLARGAGPWLARPAAPWQSGRAETKDAAAAAALDESTDVDGGATLIAAVEIDQIYW